MEAAVYFEWDDKQWQEALSKSASDRMGMACLMLERDVKTHFEVGQAPGIVTGRLKSSITSNWTGRKTTPRVGRYKKEDDESKNWGGAVDAPMANPGGGWPNIKGVVGTNVTYGRELEMGKGKTRAYPFMRPALERNRREIPRLFQMDRDITTSLI